MTFFLNFILEINYSWQSFNYVYSGLKKGTPVKNGLKTCSYKNTENR